MKHIVEPLFVSHCILVQYCFLSFVSIILCHLCPVHQVRAHLIHEHNYFTINCVLLLEYLIIGIF